jgi:hypothetical protein
LLGLNPVMDGVPKTVKLEALFIVTPLTVIEMGPVPAPAGTDVVILVWVEAVTTAGTPLNSTRLLAGVVLKLVPVIVTVVPLIPPAGLNPVMVGVGNTVKLPGLVTVTPLTVTVITPDTALAGTVTVILLGVEAVTTAILLLLNRTTLLAGVVLKLLPDMVTVAPTAPLAGLKPEMDGGGNTVKLEGLFTVTPLVVTDMVPVDAPEGTVVVILVAVEAVTTANVPLNLTTLLAGIVLKFVPDMVTDALTAPLDGLKLVIDGVGRTVKLDPLLTVIPFKVNDIGPVVAPTGTVAVILVAVDVLTMAATPLNVTSLLAGVVLKLLPVIVTVAPTAALVGLKPEMDGVGKTVKEDVLVTVTPLVLTEIVPVVAPPGTVVVILIGVEAVTIAKVPLNLTMLLPGVALKFVPEMVTVAPTAPLSGLNPEMVGDGRTVKLDELEMVIPLEVIVMGPVAAPTGTVVVMLVELELLTVAGTPLNVTTGVPVKLVPVIVTVAPTAPLEGVKLVMVGEANTVKFVELVAVFVPTVT